MCDCHYAAQVAGCQRTPSLRRTNPLAAACRHASITPMAEVKKIGRVTFRELTNEEARAKYGI